MCTKDQSVSRPRIKTILSMWDPSHSHPPPTKKKKKSMINKFTGHRNFKLILCQNHLCKTTLRLVVWEVICYEPSSWCLLGSFDLASNRNTRLFPSLFSLPQLSSSQTSTEFAKSGSLLDSWILDLQIYAVTPIPDSQEVLQREGVPDNIKSFYKVNHIWKFRYDRPFHKGTKDKENEFKVLGRSCETRFPQIDCELLGAKCLINIYSG